ncbi:MAG: alpha/beta hydrolase [Haloarculaceae archaeon]
MTDTDLDTDVADASHGPEFVADRFDRWGSRFRAKGLDRPGIAALREQIDRWEQWCSAFVDRGERAEDRGEAALDDGHPETAARHLLRAAMYYHFGSFAWYVDEDERESAHRRAVELFGRAGRHVDPPVQRIEADGPGGVTVPGNLRVPDDAPPGTDASPLVVLLSGLDSTKEEQHTRASDFHRRGVATLTVDAAGQGEAWYDQRMTPEFPAYVSAIVDAVAERDPDGVEADRLGVYGVSLGGFYAPQVAAADDRFDAVVGLSGPFTVGPITPYKSDSLRKGFLHACKTPSPIEADAVTERMTLRDCIEDLTAPTLTIAGANDHVIPPAQTKRIAREAPDGELLFYEDGDHVCKNRVHDYRPRAADWLRDRLLEGS